MTGTSEIRIPGSDDNAIAVNRPKEGEFYILDVDSDGEGHGVVFENHDQVVSPPRFYLRPERGGFPPFDETPRLRQSRSNRMPNDLDATFGGYWLVSEPLKRVLESTDPEGFAFERCEFVLHDGSQGPTHYLCDVLRTLDAVDEVTSTVKIKIGSNFPNGKHYKLGGGARLAFKKDVVDAAHVFRSPFNSGLIICDRVLRDSLLTNGFGKPPRTRGVFLEDAAASGIYGLPSKYWPENQ